MWQTMCYSFTSACSCHEFDVISKVAVECFHCPLFIMSIAEPQEENRASPLELHDMFSPSYCTAGGRRHSVSLTEAQHVAFPLFRPVITSMGYLPPWFHFFPDWPRLKSLSAFLCSDWLIRPQFVPVWGQWIHLFPQGLLESHLKGTWTLWEIKQSGLDIFSCIWCQKGKSTGLRSNEWG